MQETLREVEKQLENLKCCGNCNHSDLKEIKYWVVTVGSKKILCVSSTKPTIEEYEQTGSNGSQCSQIWFDEPLPWDYKSLKGVKNAKLPQTD
jgi:hypothetical protein